MVQSQVIAEMTIAGLAKAGLVGVETIRYYQRRGLLRTPRRSGSIRRYTAEDVARLRFIKSAQAAGFKLDEIAELIRLDARDDRAKAQLLAQTRIEALDAEIAKLKAARNALSHLAHECHASKSGPCPILTAFDGHKALK